MLINLAFTSHSQRLIVNGNRYASVAVGYYRTITTDNTKVPSTQTDFTMLYADTLADLKTTGNGGDVTSSSGHDIRFYAADGTTLLNWEIEKYVPTTGEIWAWIKVPSLSSSTVTVIRMHYGDPAITTFQGGATGSAYDANYTAVWHFKETLTGSGQTVADASSAGLNLTSVGSWTSGAQQVGKIGGALINSNASSTYLTFTAKTFNTDYTIEGWLNMAISDQFTAMIGNTSNANAITFYDAQARLYSGSGDDIIASTSTAVNTWMHYAITRTGTSLIIYVNGANAGTSSSGSNSRVFNAIAYGNSNVSRDALRDETRFSNVVRSANWIATEFNNQNSPWTFFTVGSENAF